MNRRETNVRFKQIVQAQKEFAELDPIELAARDFRTERLARFTLLGETEYIGDTAVYLLSMQKLAHVYALSEGEIGVAIGICEDRMLHEQT